MVNRAWKKTTASLLSALLIASAGGAVSAFADGASAPGQTETAVTPLSVTTSTYGQNPGNSGNKGGGVTDSVYGGAPPEFAGRVDDFFNQLDDLYNSSDNFHNDDFKSKVDQARHIADTLPPDVMGRLYVATEAVPGWDQLPSSSHGVAKGMKEAKDRSDNGKGGSKGNKGGNSTVSFRADALSPSKNADGLHILSSDITWVNTSIDCADGPDQTTIDALDLAETLATTGGEIASFVASMLPSELVEGGVVLGEGAVTTLPDPLRIAAEAVATGFSAGAQVISIEKNVLQLASDSSSGCSDDAQTQLIQNIGDMLNHMNGTLNSTRSGVDAANASINQLAGSITQNLNSIAGKMDSHDASVGAQFSGVGKRFDEVDGRFDSLVDAMAKQGDSTATQLTALFAKLDSTLALLHTVDGKIDQANNGIAQANTSLQTLNGKADQIGSGVDQANGKLDAANTALGVLDGKTNDANTKLDTANQSLDKANVKLDTIGGNVDTANKKLDTLDQKVDTLTRNVQTADEHVLVVSDRQLEENLSSGTMLVSLYLPNKAGGYLENIRDLVSRLIDQSASAGLDVSQAKAFWQKGASAEGNGSYQTAFKNYVNAYHQLQTSAVDH